MRQSIVEEQELEIISLEDIINRAERDMVRARKTYGLSVKDRNKVGISLIDRNDELCILYEKSNVQVLLPTLSTIFPFHSRENEMK